MTSRAAEPQPPLGRGLRVGRLLGVPVLLRPSWFLVAALITVLVAPSLRGGFGPVAAHAVAFGFAVVLLVSVLLHEVAHALVARVTGTPATHIVLDVWGGHTAFEREASTPGRSAAVAAAGPAANLALAVGLLPFLGGPAEGQVVNLLLWATATSNALVAGFNLLPGLPLDGGRVLEASVWRLTGDRRRGTIFAGWSGRVGALGLASLSVVGLLVGRASLFAALWLLLIAGMLWHGAGQAIAAAAWLRRADLVDPANLLRPAVAVPSDSTVASVLLAAARGRVRAVVLLDVYGRPSAVVDERAAGQVSPTRADQVRASSVAESLAVGAVVDVRETGEGLIARLQAVPAPRYAVVDGEERVVGVLEWDDVARFVADPADRRRPARGSGT